MLIALLMPNDATELVELKPVSAVMILTDADQLAILTDTEDVGQGKTVSDTIQNLKATTPGSISLDTVKYIIVQKGTEWTIPHIKEYLKGSARICCVGTEINVVKAAEYLRVHEPAAELKDWDETQKLQELRIENDRFCLEEKS